MNEPFCISFGDVVVYPRARELHVRGERVNVNACSFEILLALIEADGQIVSTKALFRRLWPRTCVAETNLRVHMYKLRRALGDNASAIRTAPNRGYWLTPPLIRRAEPAASADAVVLIDDDKDMRAALYALLLSLRSKVERQAATTDCESASISVTPDRIVLNLRLRP
jgi:DNA-binding winged helix-turn-helix (wHTH) protein